MNMQHTVKLFRKLLLPVFKTRDGSTIERGMCKKLDLGPRTPKPGSAIIDACKSTVWVFDDAQQACKRLKIPESYLVTSSVDFPCLPTIADIDTSSGITIYQK